ncbi:MAG: hypothetical protein OXF23_06975, partial [Candidatus Dadabacteria bacterium]|nr:hypothetical protein [Candidatus Dadabacteria bacterium]
MVFAFFVLLGGARAQTITCPRPTISGTPTEKQVLEKFYCDTGGANWINKTNWGATDIGTWYRVITNQQGKVNGLRLSDNKLTGTIRTELGSLSSLEHLRLNGNQLSDMIPPELGNLTSLIQLHLHTNKLTGKIPDLSRLSSLTELRLNGNQLSEMIPTQLGSLTRLVFLFLNGNGL